MGLISSCSLMVIVYLHASVLVLTRKLIYAIIDPTSLPWQHPSKEFLLRYHTFCWLETSKNNNTRVMDNMIIAELLSW